MKNNNYSVYSPFDLKQHKDTYINYLEVIIDENGKVMYAVPSHMLMLEKLAVGKLGLTDNNELRDMYQTDMTIDYITWLCKKSNAIAVWNDFVMCANINKKQLAKLRILKTEGLYRGELPNM